MLNLEAGAKQGELPTAESIRQGTVRMEAHPDYESLIQTAKKVGFVIKYTTDAPYVEITEVYDEEGNLIRIEKELYLQKGMRYIDLEHELGHIEQLLRFGEPVIAMNRVIEYANGRRVQSRNQKGLMAPWQVAILEYHNRLNEFLRLYERGVSVSILREHFEGVEEWEEKYMKKARGGPNRGRGGMPSSKQRVKRAWARTYFDDISELATKYQAAFNAINWND